MKKHATPRFSSTIAMSIKRHQKLQRHLILHEGEGRKIFWVSNNKLSNTKPDRILYDTC